MAADPQAGPRSALGGTAGNSPDPKAVVPENSPAPDLPAVGASPRDDASASTRACPQCGDRLDISTGWCAACGFVLAPAQTNAAPIWSPGHVVAERYQIVRHVRTYGPIQRYEARDLAQSGDVLVTLVCGPCQADGSPDAVPGAQRAPSVGADDRDVMTSPAVVVGTAVDLPEVVPAEAADLLGAVPTDATSGTEQDAISADRPCRQSEHSGRSSPAWPDPAWEADLLRRAADPALPAVTEVLTLDQVRVVVEERPRGICLWDAWEQAEDDPCHQLTWLIQAARALEALYRAGALVETLSPRLFVVNDHRLRFAELPDPVPRPLPADVPIVGSPGSAPELIFDPGGADARVSIYALGALLYALALGHELSEADFVQRGVPDLVSAPMLGLHPALMRILMKSCARSPDDRFPTEEYRCRAEGGLVELIQALEAARDELRVRRLEIAAWTTIGLVRGNNEDAFAVLHRAAAQAGLAEAALLVLADGMGGYAAGEVASKLAIDTICQRLAHWLSLATEPVDTDALRQQMLQAIAAAHEAVQTAARERGREGMGCTLEVVYIAADTFLGAHIGDSRVYHYRRGQMRALTEDQTLLQTLVRRGLLSAAEAAEHPDRSLLSQALGASPRLEPDWIQGTLAPGDGLVICSDGLTGAVTDAELAEVLARSPSAEQCARRLIQMTLLRGASDNCTVVVVRAW